MRAPYLQSLSNSSIFFRKDSNDVHNSIFRNGNEKRNFCPNTSSVN